MKRSLFRPGASPGVSRGLLLALALLVGVAAASPIEAAPPQGMPDPTTMSGIPRPDPNLAPDVVTIRCLEGSFANPAIGVTVELELTAPDGTKTTRTATSAEQGRARFEGLSDHYGHNVTARATVAGQALTSQTFTLTGQTGFAVMLVASGSGSVPAPKDPHGGQGDMPMPGRPFPMPELARGSLIVGALDLAENGGPIAGVEITLTATVEGAEPIVQTAATNEKGRANFDDLDKELPEGATIVVSADLGEGEPDKSESFQLGQTGYAIVLTRNERAIRQPPPQQPPPERQVVFPARADPRLPPGHVRVTVIGADDRPIANQSVHGRVSSITGDDQTRRSKTDARGEVILEFDPGDDLLAEVQTHYGHAPWTSRGFTLPSNSGAQVILRVFQTTADRSIARSAIQIDVVGRENDFAAVTLMIAVFVEGDLAFWPGGGMRIFGPEGTKSLRVLPEAEDWLIHDEEAPWVDLAQPLPPGVEIRLSFAAGIQHDGTLELDWTTPFPLVDGASLVTVPPELKVTHGVGGAPETNPHAGRDGGPLDIYRLGHDRFQAGVCDRLGTSGLYCPFHAQLGNDVSIVVEGLPLRSRTWRWIAWGLLALTGVGVLLALVARRRVGMREALIARRDALMVELLALDQAGAAAADGSSRPPAAETARTRKRLLAGLDRIYRQLDATRT